MHIMFALSIDLAGQPPGETANSTSPSKVILRVASQIATEITLVHATIAACCGDTAAHLHCPLQFQNVRLMPVIVTRTRARYNGWVTTNVPITKKEPL